MKDLRRRDFIKGIAVLSGAALCGVQQRILQRL